MVFLWLVHVSGQLYHMDKQYIDGTIYGLNRYPPKNPQYPIHPY